MEQPIIRFDNLLTGRFVKRPNRFLTVVELPGVGEVEAHLHDPGRLEEILQKGRKVLLKMATSPGRRTKYDLIAGEVDGSWTFIHSGYHRAISTWVLKNSLVEELGVVKTLKAEVKFGRSRMDFLLRNLEGEEVLIEVKGCTLAKRGIALFPDAPTKRGRRHLQELLRAKREGLRSAVLFLVFRSDAKCFLPNGERDPAFERMFFRALQDGVEAYPLLFRFTSENLYYVGRLPLCTNPSEWQPL